MFINYLKLFMILPLGFVYSVQKSEVLKFLTYMFEQDIKEMKEMSETVSYTFLPPTDARIPFDLKVAK